MENYKKSPHIVLTSHYRQIFKKSLEIDWGEKDPIKRGPDVGTISHKENRNAIEKVAILMIYQSCLARR